MGELVGYYGEDVLSQKLAEGTITRVQFLTHASEESENDFKNFCFENNLEVNEESAIAYMNNVVLVEDLNEQD